MRSATIAERRVARASGALGFLGLTSSLFVVARLVETWRVTPGMTSHRVDLLGLRVSYPAANLAAVVVLVLALLGLAVTVMAVVGAARELAAARRFKRLMASRQPRPLGGAFALADAVVIEDQRPHAFCEGLLRPRVYVSTATVSMLDGPALAAVLAHEVQHARRRDPLRLAAGRVIARALFFMPGMGELVRRQQALAELSADEHAMDAAPGNRAALARAMLSLADGLGGSGQPVGVDPARVDHLLGEPASWPFPLLL